MDQVSHFRKSARILLKVSFGPELGHTYVRMGATTTFGCYLASTSGQDRDRDNDQEAVRQGFVIDLAVYFCGALTTKKSYDLTPQEAVINDSTSH